MGRPEDDLGAMLAEEDRKFRMYDPLEKALDNTAAVWNGMYEAYDDLDEFRKLREKLDDMLDEAEQVVAINCGQGDFAEPW